MQNTLPESVKWKVWLVVWCHPWIKRDCVGKVMFSLKLSLLTSNFYWIYHSYYYKQLKVDKLASLTPAYKSLAIFACWFLRTWQTKFFDISTEQIKCVKKFCEALYIENCQLFEFFYRYQITLFYHEKSIFFLWESTSLVALIFHHNFAFLISHLNCWLHGSRIISAASNLVFWTNFSRQNLLRSLSLVSFVLQHYKYGAKKMSKKPHSIPLLRCFDFSQSENRKNNRKIFEWRSFRGTNN